MRDRLERAVDLLEAGRDRLAGLPTVVGLDGFVDSIIRVVDRKQSDGGIVHVKDIPAFAERVGNAAGKSTAFELAVQQVKLGDNGPIMANALATFGLPLTYVGAVGQEGGVHPVFQSMEAHATVIPVCAAASTDALEFADGKLMFQKMECLDTLDYDCILRVVGEDRWFEMMDATRAVALNHWSSLPHMSAIWRRLQEDLCPRLRPAKRYLFFDLADPEKRDPVEVKEALDLIRGFEQWFDTTLGLNEKESEHICAVLGLDAGSGDAKEAITTRAAAIREALGIGAVVVHPVAFAAAARAGEAVAVDGPYVENPRISTGAGDHFNSGYFLGRLLGGEADVCLQLGVATSGYYVRSAESPTIDKLATFLKSL